MHVAIEKYVSRFQRPFHHQFRMVVYRVKLTRTSDPLSVKVCSHEGASVVTNDNAIRVLHRDYFENKSVAKELSVEILTNKKVDDSVHNPRGV